MSEGVSEHLRSNRPSSLKRPRDQDLDSGGSSGQTGCHYKGCRKSGSEENGTWGTHRSFCGKTHRDFVMAERFDGIRNGGAHVTEEASGKCKLSECDLSVCEPYDFCKIKHADKYIENMTKQWRLEGRLCKFQLCLHQPCLHHVHVGETSRDISDYCSREHKFSAARARGSQSAAAGKNLIAAETTDGGKDPVSSDDNQQISIWQEAPEHLLQAKIDKQWGYHDHEDISGDAMVNCLKYLLMNPGDLRNADPSGNFCTDKSILDFHPFDEVIGFVPRWYVHWIDSKPGRRRRKTKQRFKWKQSGPDHKNKSTYQNLIRTYFHYQLSEKSDGKDDHCDGYVVAYRQDNEARKTGKLEKGTETRWKLTQFLLHDNLVNGELPSKIPVISKIHQDEKGEPVWPPHSPKKDAGAREVISNNTNASILLGSTPEAPFHVDERGITSSISSNAPPPGERLPTGQEILQKACSNGFEESDGFLQDAPVLRRVVEVSADEINAPFTVGTIAEVRFQKGGGIFSSSPSNASPGDGLPLMNSDYSYPDDWFDQSKVGGDNEFSWNMDDNSW